MREEAEQRALLLAMFEAGVAAVQAENCLPRYLPKDRPAGRTALFALGKAAGHMARVASEHLHIDEALIITRHGHMPAGWKSPATAIVIEAGHPNPDAASLVAGEAAIALANSLGKDDRLIALVSGGGSALMAAPVEGISFAEKQEINRALLASGAPIADMNRVRAVLSRIKGGRLAGLAHPAEVLTYVMSDVPGDDPAFVASGPTCALPDGEDALAILGRYDIAVPAHIAAVLGENRAPIPTGKEPVIFASAKDALDAMAKCAAEAGYKPIILGDDLERDAPELARDHAKLALEMRDKGRRVALISGGETSVTVRAPAGVGGRNLTYATALAIALGGAKNICALAADSDGVDGTSNSAGAIVFPSTLSRAARQGVCAVQSLSDQNSCALFSGLGDSVITGPTGTNVNDLRVLLIDAA